MKKIEPEMDDWLRPEYRRSDLGELVRGKYAGTQLEFADFIRLLIACIGEDENVQFVHYPAASYLGGCKTGDWTYELDNANQITLRYWLSEFESLNEPISNPPCIMTSQERAELQALLLNHVQKLKTKVAALNNKP